MVWFLLHQLKQRAYVDESPSIDDFVPEVTLVETTVIDPPDYSGGTGDSVEERVPTSRGGGIDVESITQLEDEAFDPSQSLAKVIDFFSSVLAVLMGVLFGYWILSIWLPSENTSQVNVSAVNESSSADDNVV